jgi:hypothetical protein
MKSGPPVLVACLAGVEKVADARARVDVASARTVGAAGGTTNGEVEGHLAGVLQVLGLSVFSGCYS